MKKAGINLDNPVVMQHKATIQKTAIELLSKHDVKQNVIFSWIRKAFEEHTENMPKVRVLYNATYGGYGFSKEFMMFRAKGALCGGVFGGEFDKDVVKCHKEHRVKAVPDIIPFGKAILEREDMRDLKHVLYHYHKHNYNVFFSKQHEYESKKKQLKYYHDNVQNLKVYLADPKSKYAANEDPYTLTLHCLTFLERNFSYYAKAQLEDLLNLCESEGAVFVEDLEKQISQARQDIVDVEGEDGFLDICKYTAFHEKQKSQIHKNRSYLEYRDSKVPFIVDLFKQGWNDMHIWLYKSHSYSVITIMYLSTKVKDLPPMEETDDIWNELYERFGLLCASSAYSQLKIEEVPALVEWKVGEYDGKERVYMA